MNEFVPPTPLTFVLTLHCSVASECLKNARRIAVVFVVLIKAATAVSSA
jgi:hypothetical protein